MVLIVAFIGMQRRNQLKRYMQISMGMTETEMLSIMGNGYNVSSLKKNRKNMNGELMHQVQALMVTE